MEDKIIKSAQNNLGKYNCQISLGKNFLNKPQKASVMRPTKGLILLHQNKSFCGFFFPRRDTENKCKRQKR